MQDLINRLVQKAGLTTEQATNSLHTIKDYVKEKFPMMAGAVDNLFASQGSPEANSAGATAKDKTPDFLDKISDVIPGKTGENIENFAKNAADKAGDAIDSLKDKLGGMFDSKKS